MAPSAYRGDKAAREKQEAEASVTSPAPTAAQAKRILWEQNEEYKDTWEDAEENLELKIKESMASAHASWGLFPLFDYMLSIEVATLDTSHGLLM